MSPSFSSRRRCHTGGYRVQCPTCMHALRAASRGGTSATTPVAAVAA